MQKMYTILVQNDNSLVATQRERIMQRSKLVDKMHFLVPTDYKGLDMTNTTVCLEYLRPVSREYKSEILTCSKELYKGHLEYILPMDTAFTKEAGQVELQITFTWVEMDDEGNVMQHVRKTEPTYVNVTAIADWSIHMPDDALTAIDQRLIMTNMQIAQLADINEALADAIPDDLMVKDGKVYLSQNGQIMANTIGAEIDNCDCEEGVPVVEFAVVEPEEPDNGLVNNVVEF
jgi:hypothetical protein